MEILFPGDITGKGFLFQHAPFSHRYGPADRSLGRARQPDIMMAAIAISPGIGRIFQKGIDSLVAGLDPLDLAPLGTLSQAVGQVELVLVEVGQHCPSAAETLELVEDQADDALHLAVGDKDYLTLCLSIIADRQAQSKFSPAGFVQASGLELRPHRIPLGFGKGALEAQ